jgi:plasminogen activator inhibitor 1 RNA-binding protein
MESSYGIGVKNRYAIFTGEEEEDPMTIIDHKVSEKKEEKTRTLSNSSKNVKALNDSKHTSTTIRDTITSQKDSNIIKSKASDGLQSITKAKDINNKGDSNRANNRQTKSERPQRNRDSNQTGDKANHLPNNDRQNRPLRPTNDQKEIEDVKNQRNRENERFNNSEFRERRERSDSDRRGRNGRNNGSRRGRFSGDSRGKRDLDRHSGSDKSGVKSVEKREGGGAHNWGKFNDFNQLEEPFAGEAQDITDRSADENALDASDANQETDANAHESDTPKEEVIEEGPKEKTLDEYKKELEEKRVQPKFNLRKPGEGEDNTQWKKTFVLKKKVEDEEEVEYEEIEVDEELSKRGRHKQILDIEINFRDEGREFPRRGEGRRGRGGMRGSDRNDRGGDRTDRPERDRGERGVDRGDRAERGGGADRGGNRERGGGRGRGDRQLDSRNRTRGFRPRDSKEQLAPKVDDWNDFPSLATS